MPPSFWVTVLLAACFIGYFTGWWARGQATRSPSTRHVRHTWSPWSDIVTPVRRFNEVLVREHPYQDRTCEGCQKVERREL